ncbi:phage head closure protein [Azospirillum formosense]|uniref:Phage head closure protein n=1 Tax=Azospirillum formosense TaxID=861533 RepID=A0ABX2L2G6_9PROT|nr:phage head closure protein [Azospirillum formosense]NUB22023.1 phage head closure protein [Azospirillum formosense]
MSVRKTGAGDLNQRIHFERATETELPGGGYGKVWARVGSAWAERWVDGARERSAAMREETTSMVHFRIYRQVVDGLSLDTTMRVVWRGQTLNIRAVADPGPPARFAVIDCETGVPT